MTTNLLENGRFEADWGEEESHQVLILPRGGGAPSLEERGNIFTPPHWLVWFLHGKPVDHDPNNTVGWAQPEVRDAWITGDPRRVREGQKALLLFTFFRIHDAGLLQQVEVTPGERLRFHAWAHAWSNHRDPNNPGGFPHPDDSKWSEGDGVGFNHFFALEGQVTDSAARNFTFSVGIDPTGGTNPFADTVVWGKGAHIYNAYRQVPAVEAVAESDTVTVFLRSRCLWPFKHCDAYWDDCELVVVEEVEPDPEPDPDPDPDPEPDPEPPANGDYAQRYPLIANASAQGAKLGYHAIKADGVVAGCQRLVDAGTFLPVVKAVDIFDYLVEVKRISPQTVTIARIVSDRERCNETVDPNADLKVAAEKLVGVVVDKIAANPWLADCVDYWEFPNEPDPPGTTGYRRLSEMMLHVIDEAEKHDLRGCIFALNNGTPEYAEILEIVDSGVMQRAYDGGHILTIHEGTLGPDTAIDLYHGDSIPGAPHVPENAGALFFRFLFLYDELRRAGQSLPPVVISEWYGRYFVQDGATPADVVTQFAWWDDIAKNIPQLVAGTPFTVGPTSGWTLENYEFAYDALLAYAIEHKDRLNATVGDQPEPVEPPDPSPEIPDGLPREQYSRAYVLLPPGADRAWVEAILDSGVWEARRWTIGFSADDAGIGALADKAVIAVNPAAWQDDLRAFFEEYYPGTRYVPLDAGTPDELEERLRNLG